MNTLTHRFNFLALPKLKTNFLSVITLIVLLTTIFFIIPIDAEHCADLEDRMWEAIAVARLAVAASLAAEGVRDLALLTENELVIRVAQEALELAISLAKAAVRNGEAAVKAYEDCTNETDHNIYMAGSGSCDSGGCD